MEAYQWFTNELTKSSAPHNLNSFAVTASLHLIVIQCELTPLFFFPKGPLFLQELGACVGTSPEHPYPQQPEKSNTTRSVKKTLCVCISLSPSLPPLHSLSVFVCVHACMCVCVCVRVCRHHILSNGHTIDDFTQIHKKT